MYYIFGININIQFIFNSIMSNKVKFPIEFNEKIEKRNLNITLIF